MKTNRLGKLLAAKYKFAANADDLEFSLRKKINTLWDYPNKNFNILRACADSQVSKPQNLDEKKAVLGYKFCKQLLSMIDYLKANTNTIKMSEFKELLISIVDLINSNKNISLKSDDKISDLQFPHISELIFQMIPVSKRHDIKLKNEQYGKAKTGLSRIFGLSLDMLKDIENLQKIAPDKFEFINEIVNTLPDKFMPQRAPISELDIIDFIRQHGDKYGLSSQEDWANVFMDNPKLKEEITTVINALNRGHHPKDDLSVKQQIATILQNIKQNKANNANLFEDVG